MEGVSRGLNSVWPQRLWILSFADAANVVLPVILACVMIGLLAGECWGRLYPGFLAGCCIAGGCFGKCRLRDGMG